MAAIDTLSRGRTVLMLTHRLSHVAQADRILVLEKGRITEQGRYAELMAARGVFYRLAAPFAPEAHHG
jgi:ABC-type multidrug transport system fused ATPase/permease subunit